MIKVTELKKSLKVLSEEEKAMLIIEMFKNIKDVKNFLDIKFWDWAKERLMKEVKEKITKEFTWWKSSLPKTRFSVVKKAISDYKKISQDDIWTIKLYVFYLRSLIICMKDIWSWEEIANSFYNTFGQTVKLINKNKSWKDFLEVMKCLSSDASDFWRWIDWVSCFLKEIEI